MVSASVILVEDDAEVRRSLTLMLRSRGYSVQVFSSALEMIASRHIPADGCHIIDYRMPHMNGLELLIKLRARGEYAPALLLTGDVSSTLRSEALAAGFCAVVEKPVTGSELIALIESALIGDTFNPVGQA